MRLHPFLTEHTDTILLIAGTSLAAFIFTLILLPIVIIRLPTDFFCRPHKKGIQLSPLRLSLRVIKNLLGYFLLFAGILMLLTPGQGILTMLFGISLMDFPGKHRLQLKIVTSPRVARSLNWLRVKADRPPFELPEQ
jgi:hypothetical protein